MHTKLPLRQIHRQLSGDTLTMVRLCTTSHLCVAMSQAPSMTIVANTSVAPMVALLVKGMASAQISSRVELTSICYGETHDDFACGTKQLLKELPVKLIQADSSLEK